MFREIIVSQNLKKKNVQRDKERMLDISLLLYTNNYHLLPKQNSLTSVDLWIIVESKGKTLSNEQKTKVSQLSDLNRPIELRAEQKGCPLTLHKQDIEIEPPPISPSIPITVIESIEQHLTIFILKKT